MNECVTVVSAYVPSGGIGCGCGCDGVVCVYMAQVTACITRPRLGVLDVCVSAMRLAGGAFALGAFALGAFALGVFALGAFVVHLLSEAPKSTDGGCVAAVCAIT